MAGRRPHVVVEILGGDKAAWSHRLAMAAGTVLTVIPAAHREESRVAGAQPGCRSRGSEELAEACEWSPRPVGSSGLVVAAGWDRLPLRTGAVEVVICSEVLEHCANPHLVFLEAARVLGDGGVLIVTAPDGDVCESYAFPILGRRGFQCIERSSGHIASLRQSDLVRWSSESGLEPADSSGFHRRPAGALWWELVAWLGLTGRRRLRAAAHALWPAVGVIDRLLPASPGLWMALAFTRKGDQ